MGKDLLGEWIHFIEDIEMNRLRLHPSEMIEGDGRLWSVAVYSQAAAPATLTKKLAMKRDKEMK